MIARDVAIFMDQHSVRLVSVEKTTYITPCFFLRGSTQAPFSGLRWGISVIRLTSFLPINQKLLIVLRVPVDTT